MKINLIKSGAAYFSRHVFVTILNLVSNLILLRILPLGDFGVIAILNVLISVVALFSDGGLCAYLVQRDRDVLPCEINGIISIQVVAYLFVHALVFLALCVGLVIVVDVELLRYCSVVLFAVPLLIFRGGCFVFLEREMKIGRIAMLESVESLAYSASCIGFAYVGYGVWSIVLALLVKSCIGFVLSAREVSLRYEWVRPAITNDIMAGIRFGFYFHLPTLLAQARNIANPLVVGAAIGIWAVGVCDRSAFIAGLPLFFVGAVQSRVLFPYFSKFKGNVEQSRRIFYRSLYLSSVLDKFLFLPLFLMGSSGIVLVIGEKWRPAVPVIYTMALGNMVFGACVASISVYLYGVGNARAVGRLSAICTLITWLGVYPALHYFGVVGYGFISLLNWLPGLFLYYTIKSELDIRLIARAAWLPLLGFAVAWFLSAVFLRAFSFEIRTIGQLCVVSAFSVVVYLFSMVVIDYNKFKQEAVSVIKAFI